MFTMTAVSTRPRATGHPIYDCLYLALSLQTQVPVVTADRRFAAAVAGHAALAGRLVLLDELV